jgi:uncharacterized protein
VPQFPEFKPIDLGDRSILFDAFWQYQPECSEMNFTNLLMWQAHYDTQWSKYKDWLFFIFNKQGSGLEPIGPPSRLEPTTALLKYLKEIYSQDARLERTDKRLISELNGDPQFIIEQTRDHYDYVYRSEDLIQLVGRKHDAKRNHINTFYKNNEFIYRDIGVTDLEGCREVADRWCAVHRCNEDMNLIDEYSAVTSAINNYNDLGLKGGLIEINNRIEAFTIGEMLNKATVVVHVEKANGEIRGLYAAINQLFVKNTWPQVLYINREQDLGEPQLRKAKESYYPDHMVEKFRIRLKS